MPDDNTAVVVADPVVDRRKKLYDRLHGTLLQTTPFDTFSKKLDDSAFRQNFTQALQKKGFTINDPVRFDAAIEPSPSSDDAVNMLQDLDGIHRHPEVLNTLNQLAEKKKKVDIASGIADPSNPKEVATLKGIADDYNQFLDQNRPLIDNHDRLVNRINFLPEKTKLEAAKRIIEGNVPIRIDKQKAQQYLDLLNESKYQQLIVKELDPTGQLPPEMLAQKFKEYVRDKRDLLKDALSGEFDQYKAPGPLENITQGAVGSAVKAVGTLNPMTAAFSAFGAVGYEPKSEKIAHIANLMENDPAFAQVFKSVPQREPGVAEDIAKGTAEILPLLPSFKLAGETVAKLAPRLASIPREGTALTRAQNVYRIARNIFTGAQRGALQFGAQSIATGQEPAKGAVQGASFETAGEVVDAALHALPGGSKVDKFVLPIAKALASGTTFAAGSALSSKLSGEKTPNLWEEFGKGTALSIFHQAADLTIRKLKDKPNRTPDEEKTYHNALRLRAASDEAEVNDVAEPTPPKPRKPEPEKPVQTGSFVGAENLPPLDVTPQETPAEVQTRQQQEAVSQAIQKEKETYARNKALKAAPESQFHPVENLPQEPTDTQQIREELFDAGVPSTEIVRMREPELRKRWRQVAGLEPVEQPKKTPKTTPPMAVSTVPTFKDSNDAIAFGRKNPKNKEVRATLDAQRKELLDEHKRLVAEGKMDEAQKAGQQAAFVREAIEHIDEPTLKTPLEKQEERNKAEAAKPNDTELKPEELEALQNKVDEISKRYKDTPDEELPDNPIQTSHDRAAKELGYKIAPTQEAFLALPYQVRRAVISLEGAHSELNSRIEARNMRENLGGRSQPPEEPEAPEAPTPEPPKKPVAPSGGEKAEVAPSAEAENERLVKEFDDRAVENVRAGKQVFSAADLLKWAKETRYPVIISKDSFDHPNGNTYWKVTATRNIGEKGEDSKHAYFTSSEAATKFMVRIANESQPPSEATMATDAKGYPIAVDDNGFEHPIKAWAISLRNGWEWYGFKRYADGVWEGFVHGFEDEFGNFSEQELAENHIKLATDPKVLSTELAPPVGWTWKPKAEATTTPVPIEGEATVPEKPVGQVIVAKPGARLQIPDKQYAANGVPTYDSWMKERPDLTREEGPQYYRNYLARLRQRNKLSKEDFDKAYATITKPQAQLPAPTIPPQPTPSYVLSKKQKEYLDKMQPWVTEEVQSGRDISAIIQSIWSAISPDEFDAAHQYYVDKGVIDKEGNAIQKPADPYDRLSDAVVERIESGVPIKNNPALNEFAAQFFGGSAGEGKYDFKNLYDAVELGINKYILKTFPNGEGLTPEKLDEIQALFPTERERTLELTRLQQYSTPPSFAFVVADVANITPDDVVLEPSAGVGNIATQAKLHNPFRIIVNEIGKSRKDLLARLPFDRITDMDAEHIGLIGSPLQNEFPTVVVMNPPFSSSVTRGDDQLLAAKHISAALRALQPGGRLVAIVGKGMRFDAVRFSDWFKKIMMENRLLCNIEVSGDLYMKKGTTFDNRIMVIDKLPPKTADLTEQFQTIPSGRVETYDELLNTLQEIKNERTAIDGRDAYGSGDAPKLPKPATSGASATPQNRPADVNVRPSGERPALPAATPNVGRPATGSQGSGGSGKSIRPGVNPRTPITTRPEDATSQIRNTPGARSVSGAGVTPSEEPGGRGTGSVKRLGEQNRGDVKEEDVEQVEVRKQEKLTDAVYDNYIPQLKVAGSKPHPADIVESAAMAAVELPPINYTPNLPKEVISKGLLSDIQLENVVLAGNSHQKLLTDGTRRGFFIGDGTGVGKGRQIGGIIMDNMAQGRPVHLWLSANQDLFMDATRDWTDLGGDPKKLSRFRAKLGEDWKPAEGITFLPYGTLRSRYGEFEKRIKGEREAGETLPGPDDWTNASRLEQIAKGLGKDFEGVIVFDESHKMGNVIPVKGKRGLKKPSSTAKAGVMLQKLLPKARIVYVSATGATEVYNLAYAPRLGLWGDQTPFASVFDFVNEIGNAGVSAMELVAKDLKALGLYLARSISYNGVEYRTLVHPLNKNQVAIYNNAAKAWQGVLQDVRGAIKANESSKEAKSAAMSAFWGTQQRFFNQILLSMQMPSVLEDMRTQLDAGKAPVIQLVNTNEAATERELGRLETEADDIFIKEVGGQFGVYRDGDDKNVEEAEELGLFNTREDAEKFKAQAAEMDFDAIDISPKDMLIEYVKNSFPVYQFQEVTDPNGNKVSVLVKGPDGQPMQNPESVAKRDSLIRHLEESLRVPQGALDILLQEFGTERVAEVTGRHRRIVMGKEGKMVIEKRSDHAAAADAAQFQNGAKDILVFSDKGGVGASYHADARVKNQKQRIHYVFQAGWRADNAIQGFGRTHRSNETSKPTYTLVTTDLKAQRRFLSSIARRLDQLGALTKGSRKTGTQIISGEYNLEGPQAHSAVVSFCMDVAHNNIEGLTYPEFVAQTGLDFVDPKTGQVIMKNLPDVPQFLNRLLSLTTDKMDLVYDSFAERLERAIAVDKQLGKYDVGMEDLKAQSVKKITSEVVYVHPETNGKTSLVELEVTNPIKRVSLEDIDNNIKSGKWKLDSYVKSDATEKPMAIFEGVTRVKADGQLQKTLMLVSPNGTRYMDEQAFQNSDNFLPMDEDDFRKEYKEEYDKTPATKTDTEYMITGLTLPLWDKIKGVPKIKRVLTTDGEVMIGRIIDPDSIGETLQKIGAKGFVSKVTPKQAVDGVIGQNAEVMLSNGINLKKAYWQGDNYIQLHNVKRGWYDRLEKLGVINRVKSVMADRRELYIPKGDKGEEILTKILTKMGLKIVGMKKPNELDGSLYASLFGITPGDVKSLGEAAEKMYHYLTKGTFEFPEDDVRFADSEFLAALKSIKRSGSHVLQQLSIPMWIADKYPGFGNVERDGQVVYEGIWGGIDRNMREFKEAQYNIDKKALNDWKDAQKLTDKGKRAIVDVIQSLNETDPVDYELNDTELRQKLGDDNALRVYRQIQTALKAGLQFRKLLDIYKLVHGTMVPATGDMKRILRNADDLHDAGLENDEIAEIQKVFNKPIDQIDRAQVARIWALPKVREIVAKVLTDEKYNDKVLANYFPMSRPSSDRYGVFAALPGEDARRKAIAEMSDKEEAPEYIPRTYFATFQTSEEANKHANELAKSGYEPVEEGGKINAYDLHKDVPERYVPYLSEHQLFTLAEMAGVEDSPIVRALQEEMKKRGFDKHFIRRDLIPGFQWNWENVQKNTTEYVDASLRKYFKYIAKREAAEKLEKLKDRLPRDIYNYAQTYLDSIERSKPMEWELARQILFTTSMGLNINNFVLHATQPLTTTWNEITILLGRSGKNPSPLTTEKIFFDGYKNALSYFIEKSGDTFGVKHTGHMIPKHWIPFLERARAQGVITPLELEEIGGIATNPRRIYPRGGAVMRPLKLTWRVYTSVMSVLLRVSSKVNRNQAFFSGLEIGEKYYGLSGKDLYEFATATVQRTQYQWAQHNVPQFSQSIGGSPAAGFFRRLTRMMLMLRGYALNSLGRLGRVARSRDTGAITRQIAGVLAVNGIRGLPFVGLFMLFYQWYLNAIGDDETAYEKERKFISQAEEGMGLPNRTLSSGLPALVGVDLHHSMGIGDVNMNSLDPTNLFGVASSYWTKGAQTAADIKQGEYGMAFEQSPVTPRFVGAYLHGQRIGDEGIVSKSGNIILPKEELTPGDIRRLKMGLTPPKVSAAYEAQDANRQPSITRALKEQSSMNRYVRASERNDQSTMNTVIEDIERYNENAPIDEQINLKSFIMNAAMKTTGLPSNKKAIPRQLETQENLK